MVVYQLINHFFFTMFINFICLFSETMSGGPKYEESGDDGDISIKVKAAEGVSAKIMQALA